MDDKIVLLNRYTAEWEARLAVDILEQNGIPSQVIGDTAGGFEPIALANPFRLYVRAEDVDAAREYLGEDEPPVEGDDPAPRGEPRARPRR